MQAKCLLPPPLGFLICYNISKVFCLQWKASSSLQDEVYFVGVGAGGAGGAFNVLARIRIRPSKHPVALWK